MKTVGITRALPGARATAGRVASLGFNPVIAPLIEIRAVGEGPIDLTGVGALAFTSANGAKAFAARSGVRDLPVWTVGDATARAARALGFDDVSSAAGDVTALATQIQAAPRPPGPILHAGAVEAAGDLVGDLAARGIAARRLDIYASVEAELSPERLGALMGADIILAHSPRAAEVLARLMMAMPGARPVVLCLSPAVAAPLKELPLGALAAAEAPNDESLMSLLAAWGARG